MKCNAPSADAPTTGRVSQMKVRALGCNRHCAARALIRIPTLAPRALRTARYQEAQGRRYDSRFKAFGVLNQARPAKGARDITAFQRKVRELDRVWDTALVDAMRQVAIALARDDAATAATVLHEIRARRRDAVERCAHELLRMSACEPLTASGAAAALAARRYSFVSERSLQRAVASVLESAFPGAFRAEVTLGDAGRIDFLAVREGVGIEAKRTARAALRAMYSNSFSVTPCIRRSAASSL